MDKGNGNGSCFKIHSNIISTTLRCQPSIVSPISELPIRHTHSMSVICSSVAIQFNSILDSDSIVNVIVIVVIAPLLDALEPKTHKTKSRGQ